MEVDDYSGNLGWAALDPEPINRLPEKSGDARDFGRDKASPQQTIRPVSPEQPAQSKASGLCQTYKVWTRKTGNTEVQKGNISAILIPKICITWPKQLSKVGDWHVWKYWPSASATYRGGWEGKFCMHSSAKQLQRGLPQGWHQIYTNGTCIHRKRRPLSPWLLVQTELGMRKVSCWSHLPRPGSFKPPLLH